MFVGLMQMSFILYDCASLKDKRSIVKRIIHRCENAFNISISEISDHDITNKAVIGLALVSSEYQYVQSSLDKIEDFVVSLALAQLLDAHKLIEKY